MKITSRHISMTLATLFMVGLVLAFYTLYRSEAQGIPNRFYLLIGISSLVGASALVIALTSRNELVVYQERKKTDLETAQSDSDSTHKTISVESVKAAIKSATKPDDVMQNGLSAVCKQLEAGQGAYYHIETKDNKKVALLKAGFALTLAEGSNVEYEAGEGLIGQAAVTGQTLYLDEVPEGYVKIISGLGSASPRYVLIVAAKKENQVAGIVELATFTPITTDQRRFVEEAAGIIAGKTAGK
ncbi:GAF domain-containing protein [Oscillatoria amoena NRMC-F 0135]|nr:GAF domain-containing protein [Oscillatoria amoena NRMC-F 0135]